MSTQLNSVEVKDIINTPISYRDILYNAVNLLQECKGLMDDPKALEAKLCVLDLNTSNEISDLAELLHIFQINSCQSLNHLYLAKVLAPKILDLSSAKIFFDQPNNRLIVGELLEFLIEMYEVRHAYFHLRLKMEELILKRKAYLEKINTIL